MRFLRNVLILVALLGIQLWAFYDMHVDTPRAGVQFDINWLNME